MSATSTLQAVVRGPTATALLARAQTSTFTPPATCSTLFYDVQTGQTDYYVQGPSLSATKCLPSAYTPAVGFSSPGACPKGYTEACGYQQISSHVTNVLHTCCPAIGSTTFTCAPTDNWAGNWQSTLGCVSAFSAPLTLPGIRSVDTAGTISTVTTSVTISPPSGGTGTINAFGIQIANVKDDDTSTSTSSASSSSSPSSHTGSSKSRADDHKGVAIGIGVGVGVAVLLLLVGGYLFWRHREMRRRERAKATTGGYAALSQKLDAYPGAAPSAGSELTEIMGKPVVPPPPPAELPSNGQRGIHASSPGSPGSRGSPPAVAAPTPVVEVMGDALPPGSTHLGRGSPD
ncbi:hypothetical protein GGR56DRAFT_303280 [Xylariaceae sp. FL0804]|nr:hypothetical protein GGR56DRAFT_303280 [Xylariaceae sp. FL0804]